MDKSCPVCKSFSRIRKQDDSLQVHCPLCGPFRISETAVAMLPSRIQGGARAVARASHAIRSRTSEQNLLRIDSTNLDEITSQPLPAPEQQLASLLNYLRQEAGDAHLGWIRLGQLHTLTSIVGVPDSETLMRLLQWATQEGVLQVDEHGTAIALTPKAWAAKPFSDQIVDSVKAKEESTEAKLTRGHCPACGPDRNTHIRASYCEQWHDDVTAVWSIDTYNILQCGGCSTIFVQREYVFSEDVDCEQTVDGTWKQVSKPQTSYWPAAAKRKRPGWLDELKDATLRMVLTEVYSALDADHRILAAIGARTTLERAMVLLGATEQGFSGKLKELQVQGIVSSHEKDVLIVLTDAGSASAHRAWQPSSQDIQTIMAGIEAFLPRTLIYGEAVSAMQQDIPPRPKPVKNL